MISYFPVVTGSLTVSGSVNISGGITASGGISISGSIASASFASTASFVALAQSASNAVSAQTASFANTLTVAGNLTAQTLVVQTITSSVDFVTGSTRFGSLLANTHLFTGSVSMTGSLAVVTNGTEFQVTSTGVNFGNVIGDIHNITGSINVSGSATFASTINATQGNFTLGTVGGVTGSVRNLTVTNTNGAIGDWAGLNFAYYNNGTNFGYIGTIVTSDSTNSIADLVFGVKASTSVTAVTEYMRIKGGGNVGIGIANPAQTLEVNGSILAASDGKIGFRYSSANGNYYSYLRSATASGVGPIVLAGGFESGGGSNEAIRFATNANPGERIAVSILNNGRVGINTTTPTTQLQIRKNYWQFWDEKTHSSNVDLFSITLPHFGAAIVTIAGSRYSPGADNYSGTSTFYIFVTNTGVVSVNGGINFGTWSISTSVSSKTVTFTSAYAGSSPNYTGYSVIVQGSGHNNGSESAAYVTIL